MRGSTSSVSTASSAPMPRSAPAGSLSPPQTPLRRHAPPQPLKGTFGRKPLPAGDIVATTGQQQVQRGDIPPELRQMLHAPAYALQEIRLTVVSPAPKGIVHI